MNLTDLENAVRQDLFDPAGANQRWQTSDIDRALDKAVDRYSAYSPNIVQVDMASVPGQRTYPFPSEMSPASGAWWVERVEYPLLAPGSALAAPGSAPALAVGAGAGLGVGAYQYAVTFVTASGETTPGPLAGVTTTSGNQQVNLTSIPLGPAPVPSPSVTVLARNLYRTNAGGSALLLLATLADNMTTSYHDSAGDGALGAAAPTVNTAGLLVYPPIARAFTEHTALGTFTLKLTDAELPVDNSLVLRVSFGTKHQLDGNGSTIPEIHRDVIVLGGCAYALLAYQVPTNDNFQFQDGEIHDRLDDSMIPKNWRQAGVDMLGRFLAMLEEVKLRRDFADAAVVQWGDVPARWQRL
ncbi:MAG TPA: hypothetical protein VKT82_08825 [Ktedonobacterales bacterium]|nr:hypothetical protein [Ktedonobacterales bacterium]